MGRLFSLVLGSSDGYFRLASGDPHVFSLGRFLVLVFLVWVSCLFVRRFCSVVL